MRIASINEATQFEQTPSVEKHVSFSLPPAPADPHKVATLKELYKAALSDLSDAHFAPARDKFLQIVSSPIIQKVPPPHLQRIPTRTEVIDAARNDTLDASPLNALALLSLRNLANACMALSDHAGAFDAAIDVRPPPSPKSE
jgi:hypothetical protein